MTEEPTEPKKRKVFISYSWTTPEHEQWVVDLATRLVNDGIDAVLDKWNLRAGQDKYHFMEQMVNDPTVDKVLMVCDRLYSEKANGREGGVGTETQIVSPEVYASADQTKFIPVITEKNPEGHAYTPIYLKSRIYVDMSTLALAAEKYEELVRLIYEKPQFKKPPLGTAPAYIRDEGRVVPRSSGKIFSLRSALENDRPSRIQLGLLQDVLNIFSEELEALLQDDSLPLDEQIVQAINRFAPYRDDFVETTNLIASLGTTPGLFGQLTRFFENQVPHIYSRYESRDKDHKKFIVYELLLYYTAVLMQRARFAELDVLLSHYYILTETDDNRPVTFDFSCFGRYNYALDQDRKRRLDSRKISLTADLLRERANLPMVPFGGLIEADMLLFLRYAYVNRSLGGTSEVQVTNWYPRTLIYASQVDNLPFYYKMRRRSDFEEFKQALRFTSPDDVTQEDKLSFIADANSQMNRAYWLTDNRIEIVELASPRGMGRLA